MATSHLLIDFGAIDRKEDGAGQHLLSYIQTAATNGPLRIFARGTPDDRSWFIRTLGDTQYLRAGRVLFFESHQLNDEKLASLFALLAEGDSTAKEYRYPEAAASTWNPETDPAIGALKLQLDSLLKSIDQESSRTKRIALKVLQAKTDNVRLDPDVRNCLHRCAVFLTNAALLDKDLSTDNETRPASQLGMSISRKSELSFGGLLKVGARVHSFVQQLEPLCPNDIPGLYARARFMARAQALQRKLELQQATKADIHELLVFWSAYFHMAANVMAGDQHFSAACTMHLRSVEMFLNAMLVRSGVAEVTDTGVIYQTASPIKGFGDLLRFAERQFNLRRQSMGAEIEAIFQMVDIRNHNVFGHWLVKSNSSAASFFRTAASNFILTFEAKMGALGGIQPWKFGTRDLSEKLFTSPSIVFGRLCMTNLAKIYQLG